MGLRTNHRRRTLDDSPNDESSIEVEARAHLRLRWSPLPHFDSDDTIDRDALTASKSTS